MASEAFQIFDQDEDGFVTATEMVEILTNGSDMSESDAKDYFVMFDKDEDGSLSLEEFTEAWGMFGSFLQVTVSNYDFKQAEKTTESYDNTVRPYLEKVSSMFAKLDVDRDGVLSISELRDVLLAVQGEDFDEEAFLRWHDVHARERHFATAGMVDKQEFGWYIADCAECQAGKMDLIVNEFVEATETVHKLRMKAKGDTGARQYAYAAPKAKPKSFLQRLPTFHKKSRKDVSADISLKEAVASEQTLTNALIAVCGSADNAEALVFGALVKLREAKAPKAMVAGAPAANAPAAAPAAPPPPTTTDALAAKLAAASEMMA